MDLLCIVGPTAVGKTKLSIELAKEFNGEIISGDALQFYKGLDIGTAKASTKEQSLIKHHLLDILEPTDSFSVADYQKMVRHKIQEIKALGKLPILVGGSGLYVQSIIKDYQFKGTKRLNEQLDSMSIESLQDLLKKKNPSIFETIDIHNKRRVIRALEKEENDFQDNPKNYYQDFCVIGLNTTRDILYEHINKRVLDMIDKGLLDEVKSLFDQSIHSQAIQAIGYKELYLYFNQELTYESAIDLIQRNSRRYAKRQLTWFNNKMEVNWFETNYSDFSQTVNQVSDFIKKTHPSMGS